MAGVHERNTYEEIGIRSDNGKIVINGGSVTASGGNKAITTKEEEASAGNNDITTVKNAIPGTGWTDVEGTVGETQPRLEDRRQRKPRPVARPDPPGSGGNQRSGRKQSQKISDIPGQT